MKRLNDQMMQMQCKLYCKLTWNNLTIVLNLKKYLDMVNWKVYSIVSFFEYKM